MDSQDLLLHQSTVFKHSSPQITRLYAVMLHARINLKTLAGRGCFPANIGTLFVQKFHWESVQKWF